eukprot:jgi/Botrbrau1/14034/Bobra.0310s0019.1
MGQAAGGVVSHNKSHALLQHVRWTASAAPQALYKSHALLQLQMFKKSFCCNFKLQQTECLIAVSAAIFKSNTRDVQEKPPRLKLIAWDQFSQTIAWNAGQVNAVTIPVRPGAVSAMDELASLLIFEPSVYGRWPGSRAGDPAALRQRAQGNAVSRDARPCLGVARRKSGQCAHLAEAALKAYLPASSAGILLLRPPVNKWSSADDVVSSGATGKPALVRLQPNEGNTVSEKRQLRFMGITMRLTTIFFREVWSNA